MTRGNKYESIQPVDTKIYMKLKKMQQSYENNT